MNLLWMNNTLPSISPKLNEISQMWECFQLDIIYRHSLCNCDHEDISFISFIPSIVGKCEAEPRYQIPNRMAISPCFYGVE